MLKRFFAILIITYCFFGAAAAEDPPVQAVLTGVRGSATAEKVRIVIELEGETYYSVASSETEVVIHLPNAMKHASVPDRIKVNDWVVPKAEIIRAEMGTKVKIPLPYPVPFEITPLSDPCRILIEFDRDFVQIKKYPSIARGVSYYAVIKNDGGEYVTAQALEVDMKEAEVFPALAKVPESFIESVARFFTPWAKKKRPGFYKSRVTDIAAQNNALAGVNGTYFAATGMPLGVLMIDTALVAFPISDRTALIIAKDRTPYIDNVMLDAYFKVNGIKYSITGINEPRESQNDMILYTPFYGELTKADRSGFDLTVENGVITSTYFGNTWIPENGFVISAGSLYAETMPETVKAGDKVEVVINVIPYSSAIKGEALHLVGGGPRLVRSGRIYISKYEEKFRRDIARGRAARTACGITRDNRLLLVTVDGRSRGKNKRSPNRSRGMTLTELAYFMQSIGAYDALNLDGGGSSTMAINGKVYNYPVDGRERRVSNALLVKPR